MAKSTQILSVQETPSAKKYLIVFPAIRDPNFLGFAAVTYLFIQLGVSLYHRLAYENIYQYSLGHEVKFFDSLQNAQKFYNDQLTTEAYQKSSESWKADIQSTIRQSAIVEVELKDDKIVDIKKLYLARKKVETLMKSIFVECNGQMLFKFQPIDMFTWKEINLTPKNFSLNAIAELNKKYEFNKKKEDHSTVKLKSKL